MHDSISIKNARIHNLKGVDVQIPKHKLTVITGVSGSGKSSLAFDTLYEEGKRRYLMFSDTQFMVDSVSNFDSITGLSPTIAVEQRIIRQSNPRSTVGTRVKLSTLLAALFANYGQPDPALWDGKPLDLSMFQRNSPRGMCVKCLGQGTLFQAVEEEIFTNDQLPLIQLFGGEQNHLKHVLWKFHRASGVVPDTPLCALTPEQLELFKYGGDQFDGILPWLVNAYRWSMGKHNWISQLTCVRNQPCPKCKGTGLSEQASHTTLGGKTITQLEQLYIKDLLAFMKGFEGKANPIRDEIILKLSCLMEVGLHHLALSRPVPTLSGGEIQRLFLASYIIAEMDSIIFVFDEPTIGLHELEKNNLIRIIRNLVKNGNTVIAVEHDENFMRQADYLIDLGPDAGVGGGIKIYEGGYEEFMSCAASRTAPYLAAQDKAPGKSSYRPIDPSRTMTLSSCALHNLRNIEVRLPLGVMVGVAGVSGSGKSSLISQTLVPKLKELLKTRCVTEDEVSATVQASLKGVEGIKRCYVIDQRPIGRSRTSCPATYTGIFDRIRALYAKAGQAKDPGKSQGLFSVNSEGGCPKCKGDGQVHYHVGFGNFIHVDCEDCAGSGYIPEAMEVVIDGKNIRDVLNMSVDEAQAFFEPKDKTTADMLTVLQRVGMGYITLGQSTPTISGGESQRIKLAVELARGKSRQGNLYILDEPTTGLSIHDSVRLMTLLDELVESGNSIIVTEHDPYILSNCDHILELGPGGGSDGGWLIAAGSPRELKENPASLIGRFLR